MDKGKRGKGEGAPAPHGACISCSLWRMPMHDWSLARDVVITSCQYYVNSIGYPSKSMSSSKSHVWFASRCLGRCLSSWQMIAASCSTALRSLCGQLTFRLAWCRKHTAVTATELLQLLYLACGTLFESSCTIQTSPTNCSDDSWRNTFFGKQNTALCAWENTCLLTQNVAVYRSPSPWISTTSKGSPTVNTELILVSMHFLQQ